jgi:hypothetical protein
MQYLLRLLGSNYLSTQEKLPRLNLVKNPCTRKTRDFAASCPIGHSGPDKAYLLAIWSEKVTQIILLNIDPSGNLVISIVTLILNFCLTA